MLIIACPDGCSSLRRRGAQALQTISDRKRGSGLKARWGQSGYPKSLAFTGRGEFFLYRFAGDLGHFRLLPGSGLDFPWQLIIVREELLEQREFKYELSRKRRDFSARIRMWCGGRMRWPGIGWWRWGGRWWWMGRAPHDDLAVAVALALSKARAGR